MSSSYTKGTRIAMDITEESSLNPEYIAKLIQQIKKECGSDVALSTHSILAESAQWDSVQKADRFFENVKVIDDVQAFIREIKQDRVLKGIDVARYILSKISCTRLKLEKLVYLCYAEYLCKTKEKLFEDKIYAFRYGPVIDSVYCVYKKYDRVPIKSCDSIADIAEIEKEDKKSEKIQKRAEREMPQRSRILFAKDGISKLESINSSIEKYKEFTANQLVKMTHKKDTPWDKTDKIEFYSEISDETILKYHRNEKL